MYFEIKDRPSYALLEVKLSPNESIQAEAGAMTYMSPNIKVETKIRELPISSWVKDPWWTIILRERIHALEKRGKVALVSAPVGDLFKSSYVASTPQVNLDIKWQWFTGGLFGQGLFMIRVSGEGDLFINTFGALEKLVLKPEEELVVDNFQLAAFSESCKYEMKKFGSLISTILGGEGLIVHIKGPGEVYRRRTPQSLRCGYGAYLNPM